MIDKYIEVIKAPESMDGSEGVLAIIIRGNYVVPPGATFISPNDAQQQIGFLNYKKGTIVAAHTHNPVKREIVGTQEVLIIESGRADIDFYTTDGQYVSSTRLLSCDIVQLLSGGHGLVMKEDCRILEIKQGGYLGKDDKTPLFSSRDVNTSETVSRGKNG